MRKNEDSQPSAMLKQMRTLASMNENNKLIVKTIISPSVAALFEKLALHPGDTIISTQQKFNLGPWSAVKQIHQQSGYRGFYKGLSWQLLASTPPGTILFYGSFEAGKQFFKHKFTFNNQESAFAASLSTGLLVATLSTPIESKRTRDTFGIKIDNPQNMRFYHFRGFIPNALKMCLSSSVVLAGTEVSKEIVGRHGKNSSYSWIRNLSDVNHPYTTFLFGLILGGASQIVTTPVDVVKTRAMSNYASGPTHLSIWQHTKLAYQEKGLMRSLITRTIRLGFHSGFLLGSMSMLNRALLGEEAADMSASNKIATPKST